MRMPDNKVGFSEAPMIVVVAIRKILRVDDLIVVVELVAECLIDSPFCPGRNVFRVDWRVYKSHKGHVELFKDR